jgi:hypothetical protein
MELIDAEIVAVDIEDKMVCQQAYEFSSETKPLLPVPFHDPLFLDRSSTARVVGGLVKISFEDPTYERFGVTTIDALQILTELYGLEEIARISLEAPDYVHEGGLSQPDAYTLINRLCGSVESPDIFHAPPRKKI